MQGGITKYSRLVRYNHASVRSSFNHLIKRKYKKWYESINPNAKCQGRGGVVTKYSRLVRYNHESVRSSFNHFIKRKYKKLYESINPNALSVLSSGLPSVIKFWMMLCSICFVPSGKLAIRMKVYLV